MGTHINKRNALQWLEGDERMFARIKAIFLKNVPSQVQQLKALLDEGDNNAAERLAHTLMGSSAMLGAGGMSEEARKIEFSAMAGDTASARLHFESFAAEYENVMAELAAEGGS
jgi:HPt (histidine-containing phosphotransfer) domain-containing protein